MTSLVIQTAFLGDVVLTTPLLAALAQRHGPVDVVTTPVAASLLDTHTAVRRVIPYDKNRADRGWNGLLRLAQRLRAEGYDIAYLPHRSLRTALLAQRARIPRRIGFHDGWPILYTGVRRRPAEGHEIDRLLALADVKPRHQTLPSLELTIADVAAAERLLLDAWGSKRWPYFAGLARRLAQQWNVVLLGGPDDALLADDIVRAMESGSARSKIVNACGKLALRQSAALIQKAAVLVTNDSAPLHFAQAVGTPTVGIFGPTIPAFGFGPRGPRDITLGVDDLACRPCSRHGPARCPLGHHRCMTAQSVDHIIHAIEETGALHRRD